MSDISQIMTYICLAIYHEISLTIVNVTVEKVKQGFAPEIAYLNKMGIYLTYGKDYIKVCHPSHIIPINIDVISIGIYSDHQPFFALMLLKAKGMSRVKEYVWKKRFNYAVELKKLGFDLKINDECLEIIGSAPLAIHDIELIATDLRAAAVLLIAALAVPGKVYIKGIHHLCRGYDDFISALRSLGACIQVIEQNISTKIIV